MGNKAFAQGILDAGYAGVDGYPGTPSSEVVETLIGKSQHITAGWSVNEAVSLGVGLGYATAGKDAVVCMKIPGVFQAADVLVAASFSQIATGALVLYAASDYAPSSTQYIIDPRYFFHSLFIPVIEPRNHQELYKSAAIAADLSREHSCPVIILTSSLLSHSEAQIIPNMKRNKQSRTPLTGDTTSIIPLPSFARTSYNHAVSRRIQAVNEWIPSSSLFDIEYGNEDWGIICIGATEIIVKETLNEYKINPSLCSTGMSIPIAIREIKTFVETINGPCYLIEEGGRYVEEQLRTNGINIIGKEEIPQVTEWNPNLLIDYLSRYKRLIPKTKKSISIFRSLKRTPQLCPGCPYKAIGHIINNFKKKGLLTRVFGDIGCSSLLCFDKVFDFSLCMGASDSLRQGYVLANPENAWKTLSIIGDSSECHSGLDASRNNRFRNIAGVKIILDNESVAMTGGQTSPTSKTANALDLQQCMESHGIISSTINSYDYKALKIALKNALKQAENNIFSALIIKGTCIKKSQKIHMETLKINHTLCNKCKKCAICPGIDFNKNSKPHINENCTKCGEGEPLCLQLCPTGAIQRTLNKALKTKKITGFQEIMNDEIEMTSLNKKNFPDQLRIAIRGVGGQGILFMGKILARLMQPIYGDNSQIIKGEVHGMAQKGGSVLSTFACGHLHSPVFLNGSVDILIAMERSEILYPDYIDLLKPDGIIILYDSILLPKGINIRDYPSIEKIYYFLEKYSPIIIKDDTKKPKYTNTTVLGILSTFTPFDQIPLSHWINTLEHYSPNKTIGIENMNAFYKGRKL